MLFSPLAACVRASILIVVVLFLRACLSRWIPPSFLVACWWLVFVRASIPFMPQRVEVLEADGEGSAQIFNPSSLPVSGDSVRISELVSNAPESSIAFGRYAVWGWLTVAALLVFIVVVAYVLTRRSLSRSRPLSRGGMRAFEGLGNRSGCQICFRESERVKTPVSYGVLYPTIVFPVGLVERVSDTQLRLIVRHELSHIRRLDTVVKPAAVLISCIYWFNPLMWLAIFAMSNDMERASDEYALRDSGRKEIAMYIRTLLSAKTYNSLVLNQFGASPIESRVKAMMRPKRNAVVAFLACVLVSLCCAASIAFASTSLPTTDDSLRVTVRNGTYAFDLPEYWKGKVSVRTDGSSTYVYPTGYPSLTLVSFEVITPNDSLENLSGNPVLFYEECADGQYLTVKAINYLWMSAGNNWHDAYSSNPIYPGAEGENLAVDLSTGGLYSADEAHEMDVVYMGEEAHAPTNGDFVVVNEVIPTIEVGPYVYPPDDMVQGL